MFTFKQENNDFSAVAGKISEWGRWVPTPTRVLTPKEIEHGEKIVNGPTSLKHFPHPIYEITQDFYGITLQAFIKNPDVSFKIQSRVESLSDKGGPRITLFHPMIDAGTHVTDLMNESLIDLQLQANTDLVSIFDTRKISSSELAARISKSLKMIDEPLEPMICLRMDVERNAHFYQKLQVVKDAGLKVINVNCVSPIKYYDNYLTIGKFAQENDVWVHMSEVDRTWRGNYQTSLMHFLAYFGVSSFAVKQSRFGPGKYVKKPAKRFDARCLGHITSEEHGKKYGEKLACDCFVDSGKSRSDFYTSYSGAQILRSALAVHETNCSWKEFKIFRKEILGSNGKGYAKRKDYLSPTFIKVKGIDLKTTSLV